MASEGLPKSLLLTLAFISALKLALLAIYGPVFSPDSAAYAAYGRIILGPTDWLHDAGLAREAVPLTAMRSIGYPAVTAAAMAAFGDAWPYAVVVLQYAVSFAAATALYRLARGLGFARTLALAVVVCEQLSMTLTYDQFILTDSLNASLIILAIAAMLRGAAEKTPPSLIDAAFAGLCLALAFLLREAMLILIVAFFPIVAARAWLAGRGAWLKSAACIALLVLPMQGLAEGYKRWNAYRSGERFVTTVPQLTLLFALGKATKIDPDIFSGDTPVDRAGRQWFRGNPFGEIGPVNQQLFQEGFKATDIARMAYAKFFDVIRNRPMTMLRILRSHLSESVAKLFFRPLAAICEIAVSTPDAAACFDYRDLYKALPSGFAGLSALAVAFFVAQTVELTASITLFAAFIIGVPLVTARLLAGRQNIEAGAVIVAAFWATYVGWFLIYGFVHVEDRYFEPVTPLGIIGGLFVWQALAAYRKVRDQTAPALTGGSAA